MTDFFIIAFKVVASGCLVIFFLYLIGRVLGAGAAKSWFTIKKQEEENGGNQNGKS